MFYGPASLSPFSPEDGTYNSKTFQWVIMPGDYALMRGPNSCNFAAARNCLRPTPIKWPIHICEADQGSLIRNRNQRDLCSKGQSPESSPQ